MTKEALSWILAGFSIIGVILNGYHNKWCFVIWSFTNFLWAWFFYSHKLYAPMGLQLVFFVLAIWGLWKWHKEGK